MNLFRNYKLKLMPKILNMTEIEMIYGSILTVEKQIRTRKQPNFPAV